MCIKEVSDQLMETIREANANVASKAIEEEEEEDDVATAVAKAVAKARQEQEEAVAKADRKLREDVYGGGVYSQTECPICLDGLYSQRCSILPCYHMLHTTCWFCTSRRSCPVCRAGPG